MKIVFDITKMPLNYIIINYYCLENVNKIFIDCYPTNSYRIILNSEYSATSGDFSRKRRVLSFSLLNPLLFSITLYTTLSALLLYYYCEYWMLDHITRLYAVDMCTNWVVLGSFIIESGQKSILSKKIYDKIWQKPTFLHITASQFWNTHQNFVMIHDISWKTKQCLQILQ